MPTAVSRSEVDSLHRLMIDASIELAQLDAGVESARATVALLPELQSWDEAAQALSGVLEQARGGLSSEGNAKERIDRVESALASIGERVAQFDLELDLDDCAAAWDDVARDLPALAGPHRDALVKLHRELQPSIDAATEALFDARRTEFLDRQRHRVAELEAQRDEARENYERLRQAYLDALAAVEAGEQEQAAFVPPLVPPPAVEEEPERREEEDAGPSQPEVVAEPPAEAIAPPVPVAVVAVIAEAIAEPAPQTVEPPAPILAVEPAAPEIAAEPAEPEVVEPTEPEIAAEPAEPEIVVAPPPKVVAEPPPKLVVPTPPVFVARLPTVVVRPPPPEVVPKPPPEPIPAPEVQLAPEPEPELPPLPEPELPQPPEPELTLPHEPELTLPPEPEPEQETEPEPALALPPEPEPPEKPEPRLPLDEQLPEDLEFIRLPQRTPPDRPAKLVVEKPPPSLEPAELKVVKPPPPPPPKPAKVVKPAPPPPLKPAKVVKAAPPPPLQPARQKHVKAPEPPLPPPPRFVKAPEPKPPEVRPARQIVVKRLPLPPPVAVRVQPAPPPPKPAPVEAPTPIAPGAPLPFAVERVERAGAFAAGTDGIGRGARTATIWFRSPPAEALPVAGTIPIALGCATRLDVLPSLQLFSAAPDRPRRGKLTLTLVSSGGHLAGTAPRKAHAAARVSAAEGAAQVVARLGAIGRALSPVIRDVIEEAAGRVFLRALPAAEGGKLPLEELLLAKLRGRSSPARRVQDTVSHLVVAERKARLLVRRRPPIARDPRPAEGPSAVETPREPAEAIEVVLREDVRTHADREAARDYLYPDDSQDVDAGSVDTWTGSGEGVKLFSDVFAAFIPAEGAPLRGKRPRGAQPRRADEMRTDPDRRERGGFFARLFEDLEQFAEGVGRFAKSGSRLLGKGMHYAELGMHRLAQVEKAAARVEAFTASAESFLERVGLYRLAAAAEKAGEAAGWVDEKAHILHAELKTADRWLGEGKKTADEVARGAREAAAVLDQARPGKIGALAKPRKGPGRGDGIAGRPDARAAEPVLDEPRRLDLTTLSRMEAFLGDDLSGVRIHTGAGAAEVTRRLGADAVTVRDHVFFAPGRFNPSTTEGQKLIAHELTHVLQQGRRNLDVRTAEGEALHAEHSYGQAPAMETLSLRRPPADFRLAAEGEVAGAPAGVHTAKRTRSRGHDAGGKDRLPDGEEFLELVSGRVYELLMEELEQSFESR